MKPLSECRVLLVDDAKSNLDILVEGLKADYKLSLALNGEMALQVAARTPPDLVLLDIQMPGLDGFEVCRRLRNMPETAEVPIVFLSSLEEVQDKTRGFEAGANDYVTKPFELVEVKARVRSHLKAKAYNDAVKEQIAGDLRVAHDIQMGMLPRDLAGTGLAYGVDLAATLEPAREVGGDLYGVYTPSQDRLVLVMGDVSGKGIPASLFMMRTATLLHLLVKEIPEPERILARLNDELSADNPSFMFVTMVCAVYEPKQHRLVIANAGHNRPVLIAPGEAPRWAVRDMGTALGFDAGLSFTRTEIDVVPGTTLVLYTDGVNEAFDTNDECYGNDRLLADLAALAQQPVDGLTHGLVERIRTFASGARQSDDIAILTLRTGSGQDGQVLTQELMATPQDVMRGVESLRAFAAERGLLEQDVFALSVALEECSSNLMQHALQGDASRSFKLVLQHTGDRFIMELRDRGVFFDPTLVAQIELDPLGHTMHEGGMGLHLVRHYVDEMTYHADGDEHVLRLIKHL
jgi:phosphoserine phosphatase RsbU/P